MRLHGVRMGGLRQQWRLQSICGGRAGRLSLCWLGLLLAVSGSSGAIGQEPDTAVEVSRDAALQFVEGLRGRGYFDTALEFLDELSQRSDVPQTTRELLELERGITLQQMGSAARVPEDREQLLSRAEEAFRRFASEHAEHPQAAFANSSLGELLFERARTLIWQTEAASQAERKPELQQQARQLIDDAEAIYQKAHDLYLAQYKAFPNFIDQARDPERFQQRLDAEARYLRAWFNLSRCTYERGQTYDRGTEERKQLLVRAATLFEAIHTSRRTNAIGLNARLMMGKCFQEQDDLGRALGIYNEMLGHKSDHPSVVQLKSIALHYRLICLNDPQKHDHQLVLQEATEWLQANRALSGTATGLGILWEKAVAEEKLSEDRSLDARQKEVLQRAAMADSQQVARFPGAFREPANAMNRRLKAALGDKDREPRDFETAFERARGMIDQIQKLKDEADAAGDQATRDQKLTALDLHLNEVGRLLQLALDLRNDETDAKAVAQARYLLSFIYFRQRHNFDAIIMATYCMVHDRAADPDTALNATEIAITAAVQAWNDAADQDRDFETKLLRDVCVQVLELYPQSARGNEARIRLGRVYQQLQDPLEAAKWFLEVPESDPQFASARISAGQSFWAAWNMQTAASADAAPAQQRNPEDLQRLKDESKKLLQQGIQLYRDRLGAAAPQPEEVIAAEVSLASILNQEGDFKQAIQRLTAGGENSVISSIDVEDPASRPESGVLSQSFAGLTYRLLLRAYVGTQQIDEALQTMTRLEQVGGQDVTAVYTQLGMELQEELQRLKQARENERLAAVRTSFEQFLQKVYDQRDPGNYNSLLWIGETYFGLGQGVADDPAAAAAYYDKAATAYNTILDGNLAQEPTVTAIRLRLARCRRQQQQFEQALQITQAILKANPLALDAQFEAAWILSDWGSNGQPQRLLDAIQGLKDDSGAQTIWGWSAITKRLQQSLRSGAAPDLQQRFLESRYELANSRRRYAATGAVDGRTQLNSALAEITIFVQVYRDIDPVWWAKFDRLYQDLQSDLGQSPKPLERPAAIVAAAAPAPEPVAAAVAEAAVPAKAAQTVVPAAPQGSNTLMGLVILGLAAAAGVGFYFLLSRPSKRRLAVVSGATTAPPFSELHLPGMEDESGVMPAVASRRPTATAAAAPAAAAVAARPVRRPAAEAGGESPGEPRVKSPAVARPRPAAEKSPATEKAAAAAKPVAAEKPLAEKPPAEKPPAEKPSAEKPPTVKPAAARPAAARVPGESATAPRAAAGERPAAASAPAAGAAPRPTPTAKPAAPAAPPAEPGAPRRPVDAPRPAQPGAAPPAADRPAPRPVPRKPPIAPGTPGAAAPASGTTPPARPAARPPGAAAPPATPAGGAASGQTPAIDQPPTEKPRRPRPPTDESGAS